MGRPPLHMMRFHLYISQETLLRIDAVVGQKERSKFIREAIEAALRTAEMVKTAHNDRE